MAVEPIKIPAAEAAPVAPVASAPVAAPVAAPAEPASAAPVPSPVSEAPAVPQAAAPSAAEPPKQASLLQQFDADQKAKAEEPKAAEPVKAEEPAKTEEPAKVEAAKVEEPKKVEEPPKEPTTEEKAAAEAAKIAAEPVKREAKFEYKLPEGVTLPAEMEAEMHGALNNFLTDPNPANQQALVDWHIARVQDGIRAYHEDALRQFNEFNDKEAKRFKEHPTLGGRAFNTSMGAIAAVRDAFVSKAAPGTPAYAEAMKRWNDWEDRTGGGSSSIFLEFLHNVSDYMNEPEMRGSEEIRPIIQAEIPGGRPSIYKTSFKNR